MREHEVPTHVQAEHKVLLGFTSPQIVAVTAVCAISYGAYRYAPVGPSEVRMALAVVLGLVGVAMTVGKIGGRRLPLVAADLLKYRLGARVYAGPVAQLVRAETPAPPHPVKSGPGPVSLMAKRAGRGLGRLRKNKERRNGRMRWFGKRRGKDGGNHHGQDHRSETLETRNRKRRARAGKAAQEQGAPQRAYALVRQAQGEGRREPPRPGPPVRDAGDEESEAPGAGWEGCARTRSAATGVCAGSASAGGRTAGTTTARTTGPRRWRRGIGSPAWAGFRSWPLPS